MHDSGDCQSVSETTETRDLLGKYLREISKNPLMTQDEERETARRTRIEGDSGAAQQMVTANLKLVVSIALQYATPPHVLDLIQEGNMGLLRAARMYDPERGTRFSTYATFWIRAHILKYLGNSRSVVRGGPKGFLQKEYPVIIPSEELLPGETQYKDQPLWFQDVSLDERQYDDGDALIDAISSGENVEETLIEKDHAEMLHRWLDDFRAKLNERDRFILDACVIAEAPLTLRDISARFGISIENARRIEARIGKDLAKTLSLNHLQLSARDE